MPLDAEAATPDRESVVAEDDRLQLRLWLRLLTCADLIEEQVRGRLRTEFATSLPRFDVLAQLDRSPDGLVGRRPNPADGRSALIRATAAGRDLFARMAPAHQGWIDGMMAGMTRAEMALALELLGKLKQSVRA